MLNFVAVRDEASDKQPMGGDTFWLRAAPPLCGDTPLNRAAGRENYAALIYCCFYQILVASPKLHKTPKRRNGSKPNAGY